MDTTRARWQSRCKQMGGRFCRLWGKLIRDPGYEFRGDLLIVEGKLEEFYFGNSARARDRRQLRIGTFLDRRRSFHVVA